MDGFGTQDILTGRGLGLAGFGWPNGMAGLDNGFASPSSNAVRINATNDQVMTQNDFTRQLTANDFEATRDGIDSLARFNEFATSRALTQSGFDKISDNQMQATILDGQNGIATERRISDSRVESLNAINDMRAESAKCCCETQKLVLTTANDTQALVNQRYTDLITDQKNTLQQTLNTERIIAAIAALKPTTAL